MTIPHATILAPRYLPNLSFWQMYIVGNTQSKKPTQQTQRVTSCSEKCILTPTEVERESGEVVVLDVAQFVGLLSREYAKN